MQALAEREDRDGDREQGEGRDAGEPEPARAATSSHAAAQTTPSTASSGMRRRPSASRAIGSCASTITTVLTKKIQPIPRSETPASFFANAGQDLELDHARRR